MAEGFLTQAVTVPLSLNLQRTLQPPFVRKSYGHVPKVGCLHGPQGPRDVQGCSRSVLTPSALLGSGPGVASALTLGHLGAGAEAVGVVVVCVVVIVFNILL